MRNFLMLVAVLSLTGFMFVAGQAHREAQIEAAKSCTLVTTETHFISWAFEVDVYACADGSEVRVSK